MDFTAILTDYGLPGAIIGALGISCRHLFVKYSEVQDKRIEEANERTREVLAGLNDNTNTMNTLNELLRARIGGS